MFIRSYPIPTDLPAFRGLSSVFDDLARAVDDLSLPFADHCFAPTEDGTAYTAAIELPGYKRDQVTVEVDNDDRIVVYASRPTGKVDGVEQALGTRVPHLYPPLDADLTKVEAKMEDGLLTLSLPKVAAPQPRKVTVT